MLCFNDYSKAWIQMWRFTKNLTPMKKWMCPQKLWNLENRSTDLIHEKSEIGYAKKSGCKLPKTETQRSTYGNSEWQYDQEDARTPVTSGQPFPCWVCHVIEFLPSMLIWLAPIWQFGKSQSGKKKNWWAEMKWNMVWTCHFRKSRSKIDNKNVH